MQEGIQIDGAKFALPQPLSDSQTPAVGTITRYEADGESNTTVRLNNIGAACFRIPDLT